MMEQCYRAREEPARQKQAEAEYLVGQELRFIQDHAFHDEGNNSPHPSPGEQDATITSVIKNENGEPIVNCGEVLRDPKLRYIHPSLKRL